MTFGPFGFTNGTSYQTLVEHWDGAAWTIVNGPPAAVDRQFALATLAPDDVWSAGEGRRADNTDLFKH